MPNFSTFWKSGRMYSVMESLIQRDVWQPGCQLLWNRNPSVDETDSEDALLFLSVSSAEQPVFVTQPLDLSSYPPLSPGEMWSLFVTVHRKQIEYMHQLLQDLFLLCWNVTIISTFQDTGSINLYTDMSSKQSNRQFSPPLSACHVLRFVCEMFSTLAKDSVWQKSYSNLNALSANIIIIIN